ncbi:MAG: Jag N-terminal domain-containing protein, partial [Oscillospiraceae bacterium]|nr:Jag N-terminal domain-containing protein [Oscillospiraceae bacterium]
MQEIIMTGKTVEEAVEAACASLELPRDEVSYEVLEIPQKRIFGSSLAKVRVYAEKDDFAINELFSGSSKESKEQNV